MDERIIRGDACVAEGAAWLAQKEPRFADVLEQTGPLPLRLRDDGFEALLTAILGQQISVAAAASIRRKMDAAGMTTAHAISQADDAALQACGLSRPKMRYVRALAEAGVDYPSLRHCNAEEVIGTLTQITGIGQWTAEIYAMFSLGRADVFAPGDLALQESARHLFDLPERPKPKELAEMAEDWRPWRAVAARALWAYYRVIKNREGIAS